MRHAKSSWKEPGQADHDRPLNKRGRRDAPRIGEALAARDWVPERVLSSTSARTRETWSLVADAFDSPPEVELLPSLYLAGRPAFQEAVEGVSPHVACVMVLGHNYGWEEVVEWLCGDEVRMTTANAALLSCEGETWEDALAGAPSWRLHAVLRPKEL